MRDARWRRLGRAALWTVLGAAMLGMGAMGGGGNGSMPLRDFRATLTDADDTHVEVNRLTVGGETALEGDYGRGRLKVGFDQIARIAIAAGTDRDKLRAVVTMREGDPVTLVLRSSTTFYGQTGSGAYSIRARDLRAVELRP